MCCVLIMPPPPPSLLLRHVVAHADGKPERSQETVPAKSDMPSVHVPPCLAQRQLGPRHHPATGCDGACEPA